MTIALHAITCGWFDAPSGFFLGGAPGRMRVPVPAFLIEHPKGKVLFDSGLNLRFKQRVDAANTGSGFRVEMTEDQEIGARLRARGIDPAEIRWVVLSHLHLDHVAGLASLPNATIVVQRSEWAMAISGHGGPEYDRSYFDLGHAVKQIEGEFDLFGDGHIVLFPTPGHTPGHQCARVRLASGDVILAGDCCYMRRSMDELLLPPKSHDRELHLASLLRLRDLRDGGALLVYGHDAEQAEVLPAALAALA